METLSKQLLQILENWIQPLKFMLSRNVTTVKTNVSNQILEVPVVGNHPAGIKMERSVVIVVIPTFQSNVLPMEKNISNARWRIISQNFARVQIKSQVVRSATLNIFQGKTFMKWKKTKFEYNTDIVELKQIQFSRPLLTPEKILQTLRISCLIKCQSQRNYTIP